MKTSIAKTIKSEYRHGDDIAELCGARKGYGSRISIWQTTFGIAYTHGGNNLLFQFDDNSAILIFPDGTFEVNHVTPDFWR
jgi:hypothetical protein